jgi:putative ABC transport system permease protein
MQPDRRWRVVHFWLRRYLPPQRIEPTLGDLMEEHATRLDAGGRVRAAVWLARETLSLVLAYRAHTRATTGARRTRLDRLHADVIHAARGLRARPAAAGGMVGVLALGVGLTTAVFALADPFLFRPLPYAAPDRLVAIRLAADTGRLDAPAQGRDPRLEDLESRSDLFDAVAAYGERQDVRLSTPGGAMLLKTVRVSADFLDVLGARAHVAPDALDPGSPERRVIVKAGSQTASLQPGMLLPDHDGGHVRVAGMLASDFLFPIPRAASQPDALVPSRFGAMVTREPGRTMFVTAIARLRPEITPDAARAALRVQFGASAWSPTVQPLAALMRGTLRPLALGALGAAVLIMIVCAANVVNLVIARSAYRTREFATREALGASRGDLLRLIVVELGAIAVLGVAAGVGLAHVTLGVVTQVAPAEYVALGQPAITLRTGAFAMLLGIAVVLCGIVPAWIAWRPARSGRAYAARSSDARHVRTLRVLLVAGQSATAMILLVGGTLLARSHVNLWTQDYGFDPTVRVLSVRFPDEAPLMSEEVASVIERLGRLPGAVSAAATSGGTFLDDYTVLGGASIQVGGRHLLLAPRQVTPGFFTTAGTSMLAGRSLTPADRGWNALVVNEALASRLWPGRTPADVVGEIVAVGDGRTVGEIVGVVQNMHDRALDAPPPGVLFKPFETAASRFLPVHFVVRLGDGSDVETAARRAIAAVNPAAVVLSSGSLGERLAGTVSDRSFVTLILTLFAIAGVGVTASGLVGIVAFIGARRTREIAIRMALGARSRHVRVVVVREAVLAAAGGAVAGLVMGRWAGRLMEHHLYGISPGDIASLVMAGLAMLGVVGLAAWIPANRALKVSPADALRVE